MDRFMPSREMVTVIICAMMKVMEIFPTHKDLVCAVLKVLRVVRSVDKAKGYACPKMRIEAMLSLAKTWVHDTNMMRLVAVVWTGERYGGEVPTQAQVEQFWALVDTPDMPLEVKIAAIDTFSAPLPMQDNKGFVKQPALRRLLEFLLHPAVDVDQRWIYSIRSVEALLMHEGSNEVVAQHLRQLYDRGCVSTSWPLSTTFVRFVGSVVGACPGGTVDVVEVASMVKTLVTIDNVYFTACPVTYSRCIKALVMNMWPRQLEGVSKEAITAKYRTFGEIVLPLLAAYWSPCDQLDTFSCDMMRIVWELVVPMFTRVPLLEMVRELTPQILRSLGLALCPLGGFSDEKDRTVICGLGLLKVLSTLPFAQLVIAVEGVPVLEKALKKASPIPLESWVVSGIIPVLLNMSVTRSDVVRRGVLALLPTVWTAVRHMAQSEDLPLRLGAWIIDILRVMDNIVTTAMPEQDPGVESGPLGPPSTYREGKVCDSASEVRAVFAGLDPVKILDPTNVEVVSAYARVAYVCMAKSGKKHKWTVSVDTCVWWLRAHLTCPVDGKVLWTTAIILGKAARTLGPEMAKTEDSPAMRQLELVMHSVLHLGVLLGCVRKALPLPYDTRLKWVTVKRAINVLAVLGRVVSPEVLAPDRTAVLSVLCTMEDYPCTRRWIDYGVWRAAFRCFVGVKRVTEDPGPNPLLVLDVDPAHVLDIVLMTQRDFSDMRFLPKEQTRSTPNKVNAFLEVLCWCATHERLSAESRLVLRDLTLAATEHPEFGVDASILKRCMLVFCTNTSGGGGGGGAGAGAGSAAAVADTDATEHAEESAKRARVAHPHDDATDSTK